jgi:pilus assembly protein Flp/PilA
VNFARDTRGTTAIEYAIIATGIALVIITAVSQIGAAVSAMIMTAATAL